MLRNLRNHTSLGEFEIQLAGVRSEFSALCSGTGSHQASHRAAAATLLCTYGTGLKVCSHDEWPDAVNGKHISHELVEQDHPLS